MLRQGLLSLIPGRKKWREADGGLQDYGYEDFWKCPAEYAQRIEMSGKKLDEPEAAWLFT